MQALCPNCTRVLEYTGDNPRFCAYCGESLGDPRLDATGVFRPGERGGWVDLEATTSLASSPHLGRTEAGSGDRRRAQEADPERVAGYKIIRLLGRGGMASVYEAEDEHLGRRVALKRIASSHAASREAVERFRQEGRLASTIAHPRCVFVLAADEENGRPYIVMELMPGETLQTLVNQRGALPVGEAIAKVLDVIDGLREAHMQGVIHRDVKPSNCFLDAEGRVKVGDFGLSKSLDGDLDLTRTGAFIGTPLYASPEQIKRDEVDARTDVYSVAATLYFLLTAKPPFLADDAAATLAKIVSESPDPPRKHRPELPAALEAAILRGLERDRDRRYQDLTRFRAALLPFVSDRMRLGDQALRVSAFLTDSLLLQASYWLLLSAGFALIPAASPRAAVDRFRRFMPLWLGIYRLVWLAYFAVLEGVWGVTIGKRLTGLRVRRVTGGGPPGLKASTARVLTFYAIVSLAADLATGAILRAYTWDAIFYEPFPLALSGVGLLVVAATMRARDGFRGVHEWASGTRVVRLALSARRRAPHRRKAPVRPRETDPSAVGVLKSVGPFRVRGAVRWDGERRVLSGEDSALGRPVWIVLRPKGSPPPPPNRRDLGRPCRPRWLSGGEQAEGRWDAYAAPAGCPLADFAGPHGLPWVDARPILHELAEELARAAAEGTLPPILSVDQVWVQPDGSVQLVDPIEPAAARASDPDHERSLALMRLTSALALEGGRRRGNPRLAPNAIYAAVPEHAARVLDRLIGRPREGDEPYVDVGTLAADLEADREKPTEVDAARRAAHLAPAMVALFPVLLGLIVLTWPGWKAGPTGWGAVAMVFSAWVIWAFVTRGGLLLGLAGVALVRPDSRPAERWRCAWRALVVWTPVATLLIGACMTRPLAIPLGPSLIAPTTPDPILPWALWSMAIGYVAVCPVLALVFPSRSLHDRLAGTFLVPK